HAEWIPRELNRTADRLSRKAAIEAWSVKPAVFEAISRVFGPFDVDRFASSSNKQLHRYCSATLDKDSLGDAFDRPWSESCDWAFPPFSLLHKAVLHALRSRARTCF